MDKSQLANGLREKDQQWRAVLDEIGLTRMDQPGVNGDWSMKDIVAHLTGWNRKLLADMQAAQRGKSEPPPPWPAQLEAEDDINAWIYESNRRRDATEILDEMGQVFHQILTVIERLPDDIRTARVEPAYYLLWVGDKRLLPGEFFDHFRDDHERDVRAWLARQENSLSDIDATQN